MIWHRETLKRSSLCSETTSFVDMCRMCLIYNELDLKELPRSNPFSENVPTPIDSSVPECIFIESPAAQRYTAWTDLRRFPSMAAATDRNSTSKHHSPRSISIQGPSTFPPQQTLMSNDSMSTKQQDRDFAPENAVRILRRRTANLMIQTATAR